jgi:hypothetical protein
MRKSVKIKGVLSVKEKQKVVFGLKNRGVGVQGVVLLLLKIKSVYMNKKNMFKSVRTASSGLRPTGLWPSGLWPIGPVAFRPMAI